MATKQFNVRQIQKHDTEANWNLTDGFIPFDGELIVYDKDATHDKPRIKIGDGATDVKNLPFSGGVTTIDMSAASALTFAAAMGGFIQAAMSTPNVPTRYIYTGGTIGEYQDVKDALNAGKTVWLNNNGMKQSIVNYASDGFTVHVYLPQYNTGQGVNIIASVDIFVTNSLMILYGYLQTI